MATNWHSIVYTCRFATGNDSVSNFSGNVTLTRASHGPCTTSTREWRHLIWLLLSYGRSAIFVSALKESKGFCLDCLSHLTHRTKKSNIENMKVHTHTHTHSDIIASLTSVEFLSYRAWRLISAFTKAQRTDFYFETNDVLGREMWFGASRLTRSPHRCH